MALSKTNTLNIATLIESTSKRMKHIKADASTVTHHLLPPIVTKNKNKR